MKMSNSAPQLEEKILDLINTYWTVDNMARNIIVLQDIQTEHKFIDETKNVNYLGLIASTKSFISQ